MRALLDGSDLDGFLADELGAAALTVRQVEGRQVLYLLRELPGFAPESLWVGAFANLDDVGLGADRYRMIALIGLSIVAAAAVMAALLARKLAASIRDLADVAASVARLELAPAQQPVRSRVRELDELGQAFTGMLHAMGAFATYVPRQLVRQLLAAGRASGLVSEQRELTVLFTDLSGFSRMAENRPAEETAALLNDHFGRLTACIEAEGGTVDKFLGDAVMAFWGAPETRLDHAAAAVRAAAAMQRGYRDDPMSRIYGLGLRIGIHTGLVLVGDIGTPERLNYTIVGDPVNVAARLVELGHEYALPGQVIVLLSETTMRAARTERLVEDLGDHEVRGRFRGEHVYRLLPGEAGQPDSQAARITGTSLANS